MLKSYSAARVRRRNARRARLELMQVQAELGPLASDVGLDHLDLTRDDLSRVDLSNPRRAAVESNRAMARVQALRVVAY